MPPQIDVSTDQCEQNSALACRSFHRVMEEASLLGNFVRLTDYVLTSALAQHVVDMSTDLLASLQTEGSGRVHVP